MKINAKMHYGLKILIELSLSSGENGMLQKQIAEKHGMPNRFLDSVIHALKVAGLIVNVAGKKSGYKLSRNPVNISVYDVYRAFEPELRMHHCLADTDQCPWSQVCAVHCFLLDFNNKMVSFMKASTIDKISDNQINLEVKHSAGSFHLT